ncbi:hypothetical protein Csa_001550 [Cucumis sativus]|uniref:Uncharacterized protein n=1 Tax=Cucumis sativus TaxID=3659 RepID=A0A0A0LEQ5_CUCSA|nr:hypothetical protein Csa_001550 [Cucumis sativus]
MFHRKLPINEATYVQATNESARKSTGCLVRSPAQIRKWNPMIMDAGGGISSGASSMATEDERKR